VFLDGVKDSEPDIRQNSVYGLGELVLWSGVCLEPQYNQILSYLTNSIQSETAPKVIDQMVGLVARLILVDKNQMIMDAILPLMMSNLPLKNDKTEYEKVFQAFAKLYSIGHVCIKMNIGKIIECGLACKKAKNKDLEKEKVMPLVSQLIKQISEDFPQEYQSIVISLPPDAASLMSA